MIIPSCIRSGYSGSNDPEPSPDRPCQPAQSPPGECQEPYASESPASLERRAGARKREPSMAPIGLRECARHLGARGDGRVGRRARGGRAPEEIRIPSRKRPLVRKKRGTRTQSTMACAMKREATKNLDGPLLFRALSSMVFRRSTTFCAGSVFCLTDPERTSITCSLCESVETT